MYKRQAGNIQDLKNDLRKTKELLQSEKKKTYNAQAMIEECRDKQRQAEQERDYALSHQKKVAIPVEKPVLYQKCGNCNQTAIYYTRDALEAVAPCIADFAEREGLHAHARSVTIRYEK